MTPKTETELLPVTAAMLALVVFWVLTVPFGFLTLLSPEPGFAERACTVFSISTAVLALARSRLPIEAFLNVLWFTCLVCCLWLFGPSEGFLVFSLPIAWLALLHALPGKLSRLAVSAAGLALLIWLRRNGLYTLAFWWLACQWLRFLALAFDWNRSLWHGERLDMSSVRAAGLHFCAPAFLLSPVPMEWITYSYFREKLDEPAHPQPGRSGAVLLWTGIAFLALEALCRRYIEPFRSEAWSLERLNQLDQEGWFHLRAGWTFFLLRLWTYCGLTALVAGSWQLLGVGTRYDFNRPLLSRNGLDFWRRYHNYGREFLLRNIFFPSAFFFSRRLPWGLSATLAGCLVFAMIVVVQATSLVPIPGVPFSQTYSWTGAFHHTAWSAVLIFLSLGFSWLVGRYLPWERPRAFLEISFTLLLLGFLFYNSYAQLWAGWGNADFIRAVFSW